MYELTDTTHNRVAGLLLLFCVLGEILMQKELKEFEQKQKKNERKKTEWMLLLLLLFHHQIDDKQVHKTSIFIWNS